MLFPHRNVPLMLALQLLQSTRASLSIAFDTYVLLMPHGSNTRVGIMEGTAGIAGTVIMFLGGYMADRVSRVITLRASAILVVVGGIMTVVTLYILYPMHHETVTFIGLCTGQVLNSVGRFGGMPAGEALFGDATGTNARAAFPDPSHVPRRERRAQCE